MQVLTRRLFFCELNFITFKILFSSENLKKMEKQPDIGAQDYNPSTQKTEKWKPCKVKASLEYSKDLKTLDQKEK